MTDPFTIVTGVAGILSLALQLAQIAHEFAKDTKEALSAPQQLIEELNALSSVLKLLEEIAKSQALVSHFNKTSALYVTTQGCETRLKQVLGRLQKRSTKKQGKGSARLTQTFHCLKWPLEAKKTRETAEDIHRYAQVFHFALTVEGCELLSKAYEAIGVSYSKSDEKATKILAAVRALPDYKADLDQQKGDTEILDMVEKASQPLVILTGDTNSVPVSERGSAWGMTSRGGYRKEILLITDHMYRVMVKRSTALLVGLQSSVTR